MRGRKAPEDAPAVDLPARAVGQLLLCDASQNDYIHCLQMRGAVPGGHVESGNGHGEIERFTLDARAMGKTVYYQYSFNKEVVPSQAVGRPATFVYNETPLVSEVPTVTSGTTMKQLPPGEDSASSIAMKGAVAEDHVESLNMRDEMERFPDEARVMGNMVFQRSLNKEVALPAHVVPPAETIKWTCLNFSNMRPGVVLQLCMDLIHVCNATGMDFDPNPCIEVKSAAPHSFEAALRDMYRRMTKILGKQKTGIHLQFVVVIILPEPDISKSYANIVRDSETCIGVVSHFFLPCDARKPSRQQLQEAAIVIRAKVERTATFVCNGTPLVSEVPTTSFGTSMQYVPPVEDSASFIAMKGAVAEDHVESLNRHDEMERFPDEARVMGNTVFQRSLNKEVALPAHVVPPARAMDGPAVRNMQLKVVFLDLSTVISVSESDDAESVRCSALETFRAWNADCYCKVGTHVIDSESTFADSCKLSLEPRGRGGSSSSGPFGSRREPAGSSSGPAGSSSTVTGTSTGRLSVADYINKLKAKKDSTWFERVNLPPRLQRAANPVIKHTINLGDDGRDTLKKLLYCMERKYKTKHCYSDSLNVNHIFYSEIEEQFGVEGVAQPSLTPTGYGKNMKVVRKVIDDHFRYRDAAGVWRYPVFVDDLVRKLETAYTKPSRSCFSSVERSLIYNHFATDSPASIAGMFAVAVMKKREDASFLVGQQSDIQLLWCGDVDCRMTPFVMKAVYNYMRWDPVTKAMVPAKYYQDTLFSWCDFARCMFTHALKYQVTIKQVLSALWIIPKSWDAFSQLQRRIMIPLRTPNRVPNPVPLVFTHDEDGIPVRNKLAAHQIIGL